MTGRHTTSHPVRSLPLHPARVLETPSERPTHCSLLSSVDRVRRLVQPTVASLALLLIVAGASNLSAQDSVDREFKLGKGYYDMGLPDRAIPHFERVRKSDDARAEQALFFLGESYYAEQKLDDSADRYLELVRRYPRTDYRADALLRAGECLVKLDRSQDAVGVLESLLESRGANTQRAPGLFWRGEALRRLNRAQDAIATYGKLIEDHPDHELRPYASYNLAGLLHDAGRDPQALSVLDAVDEYPAPMQASTRLLKADLALATENPKRAAQEYNAVQDPALRADALEGIARSARSLDRRDLLDLARAELDKSYSGSEQLARTDLLAGSWEAELGNVVAADRYLDPHVGGVLGDECRFWRGWARGRAGRHSEAADVYRALADRSNEWGTWASYRLSVELRAIERWDEALVAAMRFVDAHADDSRAAEILAGAVEAAYHLGADDRVAELHARFRSNYADHELTSDVIRFASEAALRQERWSDAVDGFQTIIAADAPEKVRREVLPRLAWAHYKADAGSSVRAIQTVLRALNDLPDVSGSSMAEVGLLLGHSHLAAGDRDAARQAFERAAAFDPSGESGSKAALEAATLQGASGGSVEDKIAGYQAVLSRGAKGEVRARALLELSELQAASGLYDQAVPGFARYLNENEDAAGVGFALLGLAFCEWRLDHYDEAVEALRRLERKNLLGPGSELRAEGLFVRGQVAFSQGRKEDARGDFEAYVAEFAGGDREREALRQLARIAEDAGDRAAAIGYLEQLTAKYADGAEADEALYRRAWLEHEADNSEKAVALYRQLLRDHPETRYRGDAHYRLADLAYAAKDYETAREQYRAALASPDSERLGEYARYRIAWSYQHQETWPDAFTAFTEMAAQHPDSDLAGEALFLASEAARKADRPSDERATLETFVQRHERHQYTNEAKVRLAELLTPAGEWDRIRAFLAPLEGTDLPKELANRRHVALGRALTNLGAARSAIGHFESALSDGKSIAAEAQFEMGNAYRVLNDGKRATEVFLSGPILYPFKPWAVRCYLEAGRQLAASGEATEARRILGFAVKEDPEGDYGREAKQLIDSLGEEG